jgi:ATP-dependent Clp protease protease subunit
MKSKTSAVELIGDGPKQSFSSNVAKIYDYYISDDISDASQYSDWFHQIRNAREDDVIMLHINCAGGDLFTTIQFIMALHESPAHLIASVEGMCMSAATLIFLACDEFRISPYSMFMFHNYSGMTTGKGGEMFDAMSHERKWSENLLSKLYAGFLKESEIIALLDNKDIWMDSDEVIERLQRRQMFNRPNEVGPEGG